MISQLCEGDGSSKVGGVKSCVLFKAETTYFCCRTNQETMKAGKRVALLVAWKNDLCITFLNGMGKDPLWPKKGPSISGWQQHSPSLSGNVTCNDKRNTGLAIDKQQSKLQSATLTNIVPMNNPEKQINNNFFKCIGEEWGGECTLTLRKRTKINEETS